MLMTELSLEQGPYQSFGCGHQGSACPIQWLLVQTDRGCSDGVPFKPLLANIFMSSIEEKLNVDRVMGDVYSTCQLFF